MPVYTVENVKGYGKHARVFDADGIEHFYVIECNTESGEVIQFARTKDDKGFEFEQGDCTDLLRIRKTHPAPLSVIFHD